MDSLVTFFQNNFQFMNYSVLNISVGQMVTALLVILLTLLFRRIFVNIIIHYLKKFTDRTKTDVDAKLVSSIDAPARLLILNGGLMIACKVLGFEVASDRFLGHIFRSIVLIALFWALYKASSIVTAIVNRSVKKTETTIDDLLVPFVNKAVKTLVIIVAITLIFAEWDYNIGTMVAGLGIGGLAVALAAQDTVANLIGGIMIMLDRPFSFGDWIYTADAEGIVEEIGYRSTRVRTFTQSIVTIPNSSLVNAPITNWSQMGKRRVKFMLGVTYDTSAVQMEECVEKLRELLNNHEELHKETIMVSFDSFGDSALNIFIMFFTKTTVFTEYMAIKEDVNLKIMALLDELNIGIAFPSTSIYIEKDNRIK